jgi:hypothetical protein
MKKILAIIAAMMATLTLAVPAQAAVPMDDQDVRFMVTLGKAAWIDSGDMSAVCTMFYLRPKYTRDYLADGMYYEVYEGMYSMYDTKRAAYRILKWGC